MMLSFTLSMPNNNSWNGRWSGESVLYAKVLNLGTSAKNTAKAQSILDKGHYSYNFGDGWRAGISVEKVTSQEAAKIRRKSSGFCGYDWMVISIRDHGEIKSTSDVQQGI